MIEPTGSSNTELTASRKLELRQYKALDGFERQKKLTCMYDLAASCVCCSPGEIGPGGVTIGMCSSGFRGGSKHDEALLLF